MLFTFAFLSVILLADSQNVSFLPDAICVGDSCTGQEKSVHIFNCIIGEKMWKCDCTIPRNFAVGTYNLTINHYFVENDYVKQHDLAGTSFEKNYSLTSNFDWVQFMYDLLE